MDLFDYMKETTLENESPLASRMRPTTLEEVVGQEHIIGKDKLLYRAIKADKLGSVIFYGPPGTGKTTTLVESVYETLRRENQVLVCAQSNTAVDWIAEKLLDRGVNVLRIGNPTRVNDKMLSFTYERKFESHPAYPTLRAARASIRELSGRLKRLKGAKRESARRMLHDLRDQAIK